MWYFIEKMLFTRTERKRRRSKFLQKLLKSLTGKLKIESFELPFVCKKIADYQSFRYWNSSLEVAPFLSEIDTISFRRVSILKKKYEITLFKNGDLVGETYTVLL